MTPGKRTGKRLSFDRRILYLTLLAGLPAAIVSITLLWIGDFPSKVQWTLSVLVLGCWIGVALAQHERAVFSLRTIANLLEALREGDYSVRARDASGDDAMGEVMLQLNRIGETLHSQRLGALEATQLLRKVMDEIEVAIFAFDGHTRLALVNRAGERLVGQPEKRIIGRTALELGLASYLEGESVHTFQMTFAGGAGRWGLRRSTFREHGLPHQLLVISDLTRTLREEELQAWQRLVRVLGHELNNSLTPIKSIAESLQELLKRDTLDEDWREDAQQGLQVIGSRAESLSRFVNSYARLARLPVPKTRPMDVAPCIRRVVELERRLAVDLAEGPDVTIEGDPDQLEQVLINLLRNAVDASLETGGAVRVTWEARRGYLDVSIEDEGPGLSNTANLFVPFFTTKPGGSGIGLVLSRQIAEAHGGMLMLENRPAGRGCQALLRLPIDPALSQTNGRSVAPTSALEGPRTDPD